PRMVDAWAVFTNNTALIAFQHVILGAIAVAGSFLVGISWYHLWRRRRAGIDTVDAQGRVVHHASDLTGRDEIDSRVWVRSLRIGAVVSVIAFVGLTITGDFQAKLMFEQQPMKMAAADAVFETEDGVGLSLFATGDFEGNPGGTNRNLQMPNALSFIMTGKPDSEVKGINNLNAEYQEKYGPGEYAPIVWIAYWSWRVMLGCGFLLALFGVLGWWLNRRGKLEDSRRFLKFTMPVASLPFIAAAAGWIFTEMGRQPWVVFGLLKTADANSPTVGAGQIWITLVGFTLLYGVLAVFAGKLFFKTAGKGPAEIEEGSEDKPYLGLAY
ncbi:MAG TPA: cytochrome ubiquinol oxidase subunit I, partial [Solirubrobacterales bacterium]|nr:cytochrome ubiquinol oxidase subunit I [Solirubrobacterales bacterium]